MRLAEKVHRVTYTDNPETPEEVKYLLDTALDIFNILAAFRNRSSAYEDRPIKFDDKTSEAFDKARDAIQNAKSTYNMRARKN